MLAIFKYIHFDRTIPHVLSGRCRVFLVHGETYYRFLCSELQKRLDSHLRATRNEIAESRLCRVPRIGTLVGDCHFDDFYSAKIDIHVVSKVSTGKYEEGIVEGMQRLVKDVLTTMMTRWEKEDEEDANFRSRCTHLEPTLVVSGLATSHLEIRVERGSQID